MPHSVIAHLATSNGVDLPEEITIKSVYTTGGQDYEMQICLYRLSRILRRLHTEEPHSITWYDCEYSCFHDFQACEYSCFHDDQACEYSCCQS